VELYIDSFPPNRLLVIVIIRITLINIIVINAKFQG